MTDYTNETATANINNVRAVLHCFAGLRMAGLTEDDIANCEARLKAASEKIERVKAEASTQSLTGATIHSQASLRAKCRGLL